MQLNAIPCGANVGEAITQGIRSHALTPSETGVLSRRVELSKRLVNETNVSVMLSSGSSLVVVLDGGHQLQSGEEIRLGFDPQNAIIFETAGQARLLFEEIIL